MPGGLKPGTGAPKTLALLGAASMLLTTLALLGAAWLLALLGAAAGDAAAVGVAALLHDAGASGATAGDGGAACMLLATLALLGGAWLLALLGDAAGDAAAVGVASVLHDCGAPHGCPMVHHRLHNSSHGTMDPSILHPFTATSHQRCIILVHVQLTATRKYIEPLLTHLVIKIPQIPHPLHYRTRDPRVA